MQRNRIMGELSLLGGSPLRVEEFHPWPHFDEEELRLTEEVIRSRKWFAGMRGADPGTKTEQFEKLFARHHETRYAIACANGTVALEIALRAAGVGVGDEVIVPALTFIATVSAVLQVNAIPIVVDVDYDTQCISTTQIERALSPRTKAVIPVHFGGFAADMDRIDRIASQHDLVVIEDAAHAHGATYHNRTVGGLGDLATFSFQESKTMTAGEGGIVTTNDAELAEMAITYRSCGRKEDDRWYVHHVLPLNYRLSELQSAVLIAQLSRLARQLEKKNKAARTLDEQLGEVGGLTPVPGDGQTTLNGLYLYLLRYDPTAFEGLSRDRFVEALNAEGIPAHIGYPWPLTQNPLFQEQGEGAEGCPYTCPFYGREVSVREAQVPVTQRICEETVVIPHQVLLSEPRDLEDIPRAVQKIRRQAGKLVKARKS